MLEKNYHLVFQLVLCLILTIQFVMVSSGGTIDSLFFFFVMVILVGGGAVETGSL